jgi:hypothetical protein
LTTTQIAGVSTNGIRAIDVSDMPSLTTAAIAGMTSSQINAFTSSQLGVMSSAQLLTMLATTPIVLDLNGDGVQTDSLANGVNFDILANGQSTRTGWVQKNDGLLVMDRNHDGAINDGSELFGSSTVLADGSKASNGYAALAELDTNGDGAITSADKAFADLRVWVDSDQNGVSAPDELKTLASLNITSIAVTASATSTVNNGNLLGLGSTYQTTDGQQHASADVWFAVDRGLSPATMASLSDRVSSLAGAIAAFDGADGDHKLPAPLLDALKRGDVATAISQAAPDIVRLASVLAKYDQDGKPLGHGADAGGSVTTETGLAKLHGLVPHGILGIGPK